LQAAWNPLKNNLLNIWNNSLSTPPRIYTYSDKSLKGTFYSKAKPLPGAFDKKKPKSIWTICPSLCSKIFPLCLSLIYKK